MGKITKRVVDALGSKPNKDVFAWDSEMRGFGVRVKPAGAKTYLIHIVTSKVVPGGWFWAPAAC